jgi:hypothetical protein
MPCITTTGSCCPQRTFVKTAQPFEIGINSGHSRPAPPNWTQGSPRLRLALLLGEHAFGHAFVEVGRVDGGLYTPGLIRLRPLSRTQGGAADAWACTFDKVQERVTSADVVTYCAA